MKRDKATDLECFAPAGRGQGFSSSFSTYGPCVSCMTARVCRSRGRRGGGRRKGMRKRSVLDGRELLGGWRPRSWIFAAQLVGHSHGEREDFWRATIFVGWPTQFWFLFLLFFSGLERIFGAFHGLRSLFFDL